MKSYCVKDFAKKSNEENQNILNNKEIALKYIESVPDIELEYEENFVLILTDQIEENHELCVDRRALEKSYVDKKVEDLNHSNNQIKVVNLLDEFDNVLSFFVANGLILVPNQDFNKLYVNEEQLKRIKKHYFQDDGMSYTKGPKK